MKKILVPTDFSACARAAENLALALAAKAGIQVHFLHVMHAPQEWAHLPLERESDYPSVKAEINVAKTYLNELTNEADKLKVAAKQFLHFNYGADEIIKHIEEHEIDFVIAGTHGMTGRRNSLGSIAARILRNVHVPVLFVKEQCWLEQIKKIVFAATFEEEMLDSFGLVQEFAKMTDAKIQLLYVNTPGWFSETDEIVKRITDFTSRAGVDDTSYFIYNSMNEGRGIDKYSRTERVDLIAMTTHGRKGLLRFISPSITEEIINNADVPVLSINIR